MRETGWCSLDEPKPVKVKPGIVRLARQACIVQIEKIGPNRFQISQRSEDNQIQRRVVFELTDGSDHQVVITGYQILPEESIEEALDSITEILNQR